MLYAFELGYNTTESNKNICRQDWTCNLQMIVSLEA